MISLFLILCQTTYYVEQGGPKCLSTNEKFVKAQDIVEMVPMEFIECKHSHVEGQENKFTGCSKGLRKGCRVTLTNNREYDVELSCDSISSHVDIFYKNSGTR